MRLGSKLAAAGVVLLLIAATQDPFVTEMVYDCPNYGSCQYVPETRTNFAYTFNNTIGGLLFLSGIGAWLGTYDAEHRAARADE